MTTQVAQTSIEAYHSADVQQSINSQRERVARHIIDQTKAGKPSCIGSVWEYFAKRGDKALSQKSSVSRACKEIKDLRVIQIDGREYHLQEVEPRKFYGRTAIHFCLVLPKGEVVKQGELF